METKREQIALIVSGRTSSGDDRLEVRVVRVEDGARIRNFYGLGTEDTGFNGLGVNLYRSSIDGTWVGLEVDYRDVFCVDIRKAEVMLKTLKRIGSKMNKTAERFGRPVGMAGFLGHFAGAIGAELVVRKRSGHSSNYDECEYQMEPIKSIGWVLDLEMKATFGEDAVAA